VLLVLQMVLLVPLVLLVLPDCVAPQLVTKTETAMRRHSLTAS